jgi:hypothetical protein
VEGFASGAQFFACEVNLMRGLLKRLAETPFAHQGFVYYTG